MGTCGQDTRRRWSPLVAAPSLDQCTPAGDSDYVESYVLPADIRRISNRNAQRPIGLTVRLVLESLPSRGSAQHKDTEQARVVLAESAHPFQK